jgi:hypothetical protein
MILNLSCRIFAGGVRPFPTIIYGEGAWQLTSKSFELRDFNEVYILLRKGFEAQSTEVPEWFSTIVWEVGWSVCRMDFLPKFWSLELIWTIRLKGTHVRRSIVQSLRVQWFRVWENQEIMLRKALKSRSLRVSKFREAFVWRFKVREKHDVNSRNYLKSRSARVTWTCSKVRHSRVIRCVGVKSPKSWSVEVPKC